MALELPHKKVLVLASICASVLLVSLAFRLASERGEAQAIQTGDVQIVAGQSEQASVADQRILDALQKSQLEGISSTSTNPFAPSPKDSLSERFSKDVFSAFLKFNQQGNTADTASLAQEPVNNVNPRDLPQDKYTLADIKIFVPKTKDEIKNYGEKFALEYVTILKKVTDNPEYYNVLSNLSLIYKELAVKLLAIPAPDRAATVHLELVNAFSKVGESLPIVEQQGKDPVRALLALRVVQEALIKQASLFTGLKTYFEQNGILFDEQGYGRMWNIEKMQAPTLTQ